MGYIMPIYIQITPKVLQKSYISSTRPTWTSRGLFSGETSPTKPGRDRTGWWTILLGNKVP